MRQNGPLNIAPVGDCRRVAESATRGAGNGGPSIRGVRMAPAADGGFSGSGLHGLTPGHSRNIHARKSGPMYETMPFEPVLGTVRTASDCTLRGPVRPWPGRLMPEKFLGLGKRARAADKPDETRPAGGRTPRHAAQCHGAGGPGGQARLGPAPGPEHARCHRSRPGRITNFGGQRAKNRTGHAQ